MGLICALCGMENETARGSFSGVCAGCGCFLHACVQCRLYCESSRSCASSTTEKPGDPMHGNFCEEFEPFGRKRHDSGSTGKPTEAVNRFHDLFGGDRSRGS
jgi:hypothetical protein